MISRTDLPSIPRRDRARQPGSSRLHSNITTCWSRGSRGRPMRYLYTQSTCLAGRRLPRALVQCVLFCLCICDSLTASLYRPVALSPSSLLHKSCTEYSTHSDHRQYPAPSPISHTCAVVSLKPPPYFFISKTHKTTNFHILS